MTVVMNQVSTTKRISEGRNRRTAAPATPKAPKASPPVKTWLFNCAEMACQSASSMARHPANRRAKDAGMGKRHEGTERPWSGKRDESRMCAWYKARSIYQEWSTASTAPGEARSEHGEKIG